MEDLEESEMNHDRDRGAMEYRNINSHVGKETKNAIFRKISETFHPSHDRQALFMCYRTLF